MPTKYPLIKENNIYTFLISLLKKLCKLKIYFTTLKFKANEKSLKEKQWYILFINVINKINLS